MTLEPLPSQRQPFIDRNRYITSYWWPWMKRVFDLVRENTDAVTSVTETISQIDQSWAVSINADEHVIGLVKLDASDLTTTFTVVADKFVVANPGDGTDTQTIFAAGLVDGAPTVGIAGSLILDGTVIADALNVTTLSSVTADVGTLTAGIIQSADGKMVIDLDNGTLSITAGS